jgi:hypothetical protein
VNTDQGSTIFVFVITFIFQSEALFTPHLSGFTLPTITLYLFNNSSFLAIIFLSTYKNHQLLTIQTELLNGSFSHLVAEGIQNGLRG